MEAKKPKKLRSDGLPSKNSDFARSSLPSTFGNRPSHKERGNSAPLISHSSWNQSQATAWSQTSSKQEGNISDIGSGALSAPSSPVNRKAAYDTRNSGVQSQVQGSGNVNEVVIAVLGVDAVGKSTFVHLALDLKKLTTSLISSKKVSLEGSISVVRLIEIKFGDVDIEGESVVWPKMVGEQAIPPIDGALVMYSVLDQSSITPLPPILNALSKDHIPAIVVASHCDQSPKTWRVDHGKIERLCSRFQGVECFQTSISIPETHKRCVSIILRNVMLARNGDPCKTRYGLPSRPRASTSFQPTSPTRKAKSIGEPRRHGRAASEISNSISKRDSIRNEDLAFKSINPKVNQDAPGKDSQEANEWQNPHLNDESSSEASDSSDNDSSEDEPESQNTDVTEQQTPPKFDLRSSASESRDSATNDAFPDEAVEGVRNLAKTSSTAPVETFLKGGGDDEDERESGATFDELVDRLLSQPLSRSDSKFAAIFLCFYRKFAAPSELLLAFIQRFENIGTSDQPELIRCSTQLRHLTILKDWVADYPGDFGHPLTYRIITAFVQGLAGSPIFAVAHKEISMHLEIVSEDDDTEWACSDRSRSRASTMESFLTMSSSHSVNSTVTADSSTDDILEQSTTLEKVPTGRSVRVSSTPSTVSAADKPTNPSTTSFQTSLQAAENAQRQAQLLTPAPRVVLDKIRWYQLMEIPDEQIAKELTRIDWIMYSSIKPRDLVRHISLPADQKERCKGLEHVNRLINQFNHVAFWVANLILLRDKPKDRARALEKFMGVAWKLRHLNNYNSLGAVIAGINGTAVHRLSQTRELVLPEAQKQFMRLEILMGTQKSHFAYRLAWENTSTARIPFLPLHRRDLVLTEEANPTFTPGSSGEFVNWRKFEIMGQVVIDIRMSQQLPYASLKKHDEVQRLLLDGMFPKDDDELYERSCQLERPGAGENPRKKFNWFQR